MEQTKYDVFISYSRNDYVDEKGNVRSDSDVSKILAALKEANISYWYDQKGILHGEDFGEKILKYIKLAKFFVYLSTAEANSSEWTRNEIACALMYKKKIIPVRIDESPFHDSVMFRIAALDHINYYLNPEKGREELIDSIKRYLAEEKAAAARREEEERYRREEQERQRRQQEELNRRQQQADELRVEINKTQEECSSLEKALLQKKLDVEVVNAELNSKLKHLDEQKLQMNAILHDEIDTPQTTNAPSSVVPVVQAEDIGFQFHWCHPLNSLRGMWQKMKETAIKRHWTVTVLLSMCLAATVPVFLVALVLSRYWSIAICFLAIFTIYAILQLMANKRSGIGFLFLSPIMISLIAYFTRDDLYRRLLSNWDNGEFPLAIMLLSCVAILVVLPIFLIRKNGNTAWRLLDGKVYHALQVNKHPTYYLLYAVGLLLAFSSFENNIEYCRREVLKKEDLAKGVLVERDSLYEITNAVGAHELYLIGNRNYNEQMYEKAVRFYLLALDKGLVRDNEKWAQYNLGICYEKGLGVKPDTLKAIDYYDKAYAGGNCVYEASLSRDRLNNK